MEKKNLQGATWLLAYLDDATYAYYNFTGKTAGTSRASSVYLSEPLRAPTRPNAGPKNEYERPRALSTRPARFTCHVYCEPRDGNWAKEGKGTSSNFHFGQQVSRPAYPIRAPLLRRRPTIIVRLVWAHHFVLPRSRVGRL